MNSSPTSFKEQPHPAQEVTFDFLRPGDLVVCKYGHDGTQIALVRWIRRNAHPLQVRAWKFSWNRGKWTVRPRVVYASEIVGIYQPEDVARSRRHLVESMHADVARFWEAYGRGLA